ncbi:unnamed protein product [Diatraea saccharalis]|uniref:C2H2-type domain-containing protein n=1 Tax=Diatraea saccharalis TaxID=40085 RepID=A0A9N9R701_9NEOP|nr:unnamed protein product [Diatraea saccharalis]
MKEIDINIEGYNVNGICVGCLNYNRKMFYQEDIKKCFNKLADIDIPDGLSVQVCWECLANVQRVCQFSKQILKSYDILINYSRQHTFLNSPSDFTNHSTSRLNISETVTYEMLNSSSKLSDENEQNDDKLELKTELISDQYDADLESLKIEDDNYQHIDNDVQFDDHVHDQSSEDDMQLSKLKQKKEKSKKVKKHKKDTEEKLKTADKTVKDPQKKLKNLPPDLVQVYMMNDEEMWTVRSEDQDNKYFGKLRMKCLMCLITFNSEKHEAEHMAGKHRPKGDDCLQCDVCKAYFLTKDHLSAHRSLHLVAYRCKECGLRTSVKAIIRKHIKTHQGDINEFHCKTCDKIFSSRSKLSYHRSKHHKEKLQCDCCGKVFASKMTLKYHIKVLGSNKDEKPKEKLNIPCKGCNKVFPSKKSYRAHVVIHNGITYPCPICGKAFQWKRNLARHTRNHRERDAGALHECRECGKTFSSRDCYNNHMKLSKRHVPEDAYVHECNYCGKKFATKWCMVDHIDWDHLKVIKYQCSVCFKAFKTAKIMVAHMNNIHEGKKNKEPDGEHLCEICGKSYKTVKRLKGHVWAMHTNRSSSKNFKCKLCPATFAWQTSIYKHMKMMHENKRSKQSRLQSVKKQESYTDVESTARMQYFQQNNLIQNIVLVPQATVPPHVV